MKRGFTIVELLIVVVVIAILAAISVIAYNGIQNRANDSAVESDLRQIGSQILQFSATEGNLPTLAAEFTSMKMKVSGNAYGNGYLSNAYNMAYCYNATTNVFVVVAASKSGKVYVFNGGVKEGIGPISTILTTCSNNGVSTSTASWFYSGGAWQAGIQS